MRTPITFPQLEAKIRELVAANPEYKYPTEAAGSCLYNEGVSTDFFANPVGLPPCLFGRAFIELGHPVPRRFEGEGIGVLMKDLLAEAPTDAEIIWADALQSYQDSGKPWAWCLEKADERKREYSIYESNDQHG